jgi:hypothetical protein
VLLLDMGDQFFSGQILLGFAHRTSPK